MFQHFQTMVIRTFNNCQPIFTSPLFSSVFRVIMDEHIFRCDRNSSFLDARSTLQLANAFPILENFLALPTLWRRLLIRADFKDERLVDQMVAFAGEREHIGPK